MDEPGGPAGVAEREGGAVRVQRHGGVQGSSLHREVGDGQATRHVSC